MANKKNVKNESNNAFEEVLERDDLETIIDKYSPDEMAIEELFFNTNQKTDTAKFNNACIFICKFFNFFLYYGVNLLERDFLFI